MRIHKLVGLLVASTVTVGIMTAAGPAVNAATEETTTGGGTIDGPYEAETQMATRTVNQGQVVTTNSNPPGCSSGDSVFFWNPKNVTLVCALEGDIVKRISWTPLSVDDDKWVTDVGYLVCPNPMPAGGQPALGSTHSISKSVWVTGNLVKTGERTITDREPVPADPGTPDLEPGDPGYRPPTPAVPGQYHTEYTYNGQFTTGGSCGQYTAPTFRPVDCAQAGDAQVMGPYDTNGDPMIPETEGGSLTREPNGPGTGYSVVGRVNPEETSLGQAMSPGRNPRNQPASKADVEKYCLSGDKLVLRGRYSDYVDDYGRYVVPVSIYYTTTQFLEFKSWGTNPTVLSKVWPNYYGTSGWFSSPGYYPHWIDNTSLTSESYMRYYNLRCKNAANATEAVFVRNIPSGAGWQGANWGPYEPLGDQTYTFNCSGDPDDPTPSVPIDEDCTDPNAPCISGDDVRTTDLVRCEPSTGSQFPVNGKAGAPIEFSSPDRFNSKDYFEANATGTPYFIRWEKPKAVLASNGKDVTTIAGSDAEWRVRYDLTPSSSPILIKNPVTGKDVDNVNDRNQPYNVWADQTPDSMANKPDASTPWFPNTWSGDPMSVPLDKWSAREDNAWPEETRALWLRFFQATTGGRYGWQLTPTWEVTASVPVASRTAIFKDYTALGYWVPQFGGVATQTRREAFTCPGQRLNVNVTRSVDLFR